MAYNDVVRLRVYHLMQGAQVVNVYHFLANNAVLTQEPVDLANDFVTNMRATLIARTVNSCNFQYVECQKIVPFSGGPAVVSFPANTNGTMVGAAVSATLCEVMTIYSQRGGRRGRGRVYLPSGDCQNSLPSNGIWNNNNTTKTQAYATALVARYIDLPGAPANWHLGVWSRRSGPVNPPWTTDQFARATGCVVRTTIRNQRRRQAGVGR
jgi:hypothetical protein